MWFKASSLLILASVGAWIIIRIFSSFMFEVQHYGVQDIVLEYAFPLFLVALAAWAICARRATGWKQILFAAIGSIVAYGWIIAVSVLIAVLSL